MGQEVKGGKRGKRVGQEVKGGTRGTGWNKRYRVQQEVKSQSNGTTVRIAHLQHQLNNSGVLQYKWRVS